MLTVHWKQNKRKNGLSSRVSPHIIFHKVTYDTAYLAGGWRVQVCIFCYLFFYLSQWWLFSRQHLSKFRCYFWQLFRSQRRTLGGVDSIWQVTSDCSALEIKKFLETGWELVPHCLSKSIFGGYLFEVICVSHFNINYVIIEIKNVCFRTYFVFIVSNSSIFHVLDECLSNHFIPFHLLVPCLKNTGPRPKFIFG